MRLAFHERGGKLAPAQREARMDAVETMAPMVDDILLYIRRKDHLSAEEWEDFHSWAWVKLVESDYDVLRKFEGRGSMRAYLAVVFHRYLLDYRVQKWGRWRPSAKANALGPGAVRLEFLMRRQGYSAGDAVRTLVIEGNCGLGEEELLDVAARLPLRRKDWTSAEDWLEQLPCHRPSPAGALRAREAEGALGRIEDSLSRALAKLDDEERLALKMRYEQGVKLKQIAVALGRKPKRFYRQFERIHARLRRVLRDDGIDAGYLEIAFPKTEWGEFAKSTRP